MTNYVDIFGSSVSNDVSMYAAPSLSPWV